MASAIVVIVVIIMINESRRLTLDLPLKQCISVHTDKYKSDIIVAISNIFLHIFSTSISQY